MRKLKTFIIAALLFPAAGMLMASMSLTTTSNTVEVPGGIPVNQASSLGSITATNTGDVQLKVRVEALTPEPGDVEAGCTAIPDVSWLSYDKNDFFLSATQKSTISVKAKVPYGGGRYKAYLWTHSINDGATQVGTIVPVYFSVQDSVVRMLSNNKFFPPSRIGLRKNKLVVRLQIYTNSVVKANLNYRKLGASSAFSAVPFSLTAVDQNTYFAKAEIPPSFIVPPGIEYYIDITAGSDISYIPDTAPGTNFTMEVVNTTTGRINKKGGKLQVDDSNPDDGETMLEVPSGSLSAETEMSVTQVDTDSLPPASGRIVLSSSPVMAFEFGPSGATFKRPVKLSMLYFDLDGDGIVDGTDFKETDLRLFWWDGYEWRLVGGRVDPLSKVVYATISHFSLYAIFPAGALTADDYRPKERIITPGTRDGVNDYANFDGLAGGTFDIRIYDVTGRQVRKITDESASGPRWDGMDENNHVVESGVYIYQFKADVGGSMKLISGMIAVAK